MPQQVRSTFATQRQMNHDDGRFRLTIETEGYPAHVRHTTCITLRSHERHSSEPDSPGLVRRAESQTWGKQTRACWWWPRKQELPGDVGILAGFG
jgi:hypothetical protein